MDSFTHCIELLVRFLKVKKTRKIFWLENLAKNNNTTSEDLMFSSLLVQSLSMTGADLNSSSKPWFIQEKTASLVYAEFHEQVMRAVKTDFVQIRHCTNDHKACTNMKIEFTVRSRLFSRMLVQALSMTGSDLCSASKPWSAQEATADIIYAEFYEQVIAAVQIKISFSNVADLSLYVGEILSKSKPSGDCHSFWSSQSLPTRCLPRSK